MPGDPEPAANWNIYYQRGIAYERLKQWPKAEPNFRKALELFPNQPQVMNYLGYSWIDMNMNLEEGMEMIRKAVDLRPERRLHRRFARLGALPARPVRGRRARARARRSLKPDDPVLNDHLGDAYWRAGRRLEATFQWSHARDMKPEPDVLAGVEKKLDEGLPPVEDKAVAEEPQGRRLRRPSSRRPPRRRTSAPRPSRAATAPKPIPPSTRCSAASRCGRSPPTSSATAAATSRSSNLNPQLQGDPGRLMPGQELTLPAVGN